jgi:ABC-2 type transport system ATP-binding protein
MSVIEVRKLRKRYGDRVAIDDVSFDVREGEIFGVIGANGAGKTTTVECVAGLRVPDGGDVRVFGFDPYRNRSEITSRVGVQLQRSELQANLRVGEAMQLFGSFYNRADDGRELLESLGLGAEVSTRFSNLSLGQQQRLSIALALIGDPKLAILDELTTGLDPAGRRDTWGVIEDIRERGVTILLVTHFMSEAEYLCDRVAVIDAGRVIALDSPTALSALPNVEQRIRFVPSQPIRNSDLESLRGVRSVSQRGNEVLVIGSADTLAAVIAQLGRLDIVAGHLRVEQPNLEDAFLAITDHADGPSAEDERLAKRRKNIR